MVVMTVHTPQLHVLTVDLEYFADDFHLLHPQVIVEMLNDMTILVLQFHAERIEMWLLGRP